MLEISQLQIPVFFLVSTRDNLAASFRFFAHGLFIYSTLIKLPFGRPRQTKNCRSVYRWTQTKPLLDRL